jgi:hypothetical protein
LTIFGKIVAMKYFTVLACIVLALACKQKILTGKDLENKLKVTMQSYLDTTLARGVKAEVRDVAYYPEKDRNYFICRFHVAMRYANKDTVGIVAATISQDFSLVTRTQ